MRKVLQLDWKPIVSGSEGVLLGGCQGTGPLLRVPITTVAIIKARLRGPRHRSPCTERTAMVRSTSPSDERVETPGPTK